MQNELFIGPIDARRADLAALLKEADRYLLERYPPELCFLEDAEALARNNVTLLGAFQGKRLVGMGAIKRLMDGETYAEIKRLFVTASARGTKMGRRLMEALETESRRHGIRLVRLETGTEQPEAIALYQSLGYVVRGPYGDYAENGISVFMEKRLNRD